MSKKKVRFRKLVSMNDYTTWVLLLQTRDAMLKARQKELRQYGISAEEAATLFIIRANGNNITPAEISRWMLREPHSVSGLVSRMERKGLVRKDKDLRRKNMVRVSLTEKGQQAYYHSTKLNSIQWVMSCLSEAERQQLRSSLEKLREMELRELGLKDRLPLINYN